MRQKAMPSSLMFKRSLLVLGEMFRSPTQLQAPSAFKWLAMMFNLQQLPPLGTHHYHTAPTPFAQKSKTTAPALQQLSSWVTLMK